MLIQITYTSWSQGCLLWRCEFLYSLQGYRNCLTWRKTFGRQSLFYMFFFTLLWVYVCMLCIVFSLAKAGRAKQLLDSISAFTIRLLLFCIARETRPKNVVSGLRWLSVGWVGCKRSKGCKAVAVVCLCVCVFARSRPAYWQHWQPLAHRRNFATCSPKFSLPVFALSNSRAAQVVFPSRFMHSSATAFATAAVRVPPPTPLQVTAAVAAMSGIKWVFAICNGCKFSGLLTHSK